MWPGGGGGGGFRGIFCCMRQQAGFVFILILFQCAGICGRQPDRPRDDTDRLHCSLFQCAGICERLPNPQTDCIVHSFIVQVFVKDNQTGPETTQIDCIVHCFNVQVFVKDNQTGPETTQIDYIGFLGSPVSTTNMGEFKRVSVVGRSFRFQTCIAGSSFKVAVTKLSKHLKKLAAKGLLKREILIDWGKGWWLGGGGRAWLVELQVEKPGAVLMLVRFLLWGKGFFSSTEQSTFSADF